MSGPIYACSCYKWSHITERLGFIQLMGMALFLSFEINDSKWGLGWGEMVWGNSRCIAADIVFSCIRNHVEPGEKEVSSDWLFWTNRINTMGNMENGEKSKLNTDFWNGAEILTCSPWYSNFFSPCITCSGSKIDLSSRWKALRPLASQPLTGC